MRPDDGVLKTGFAQRLAEERGNPGRTGNGPEIVEDESESHGPAVGADGLEDAPHERDLGGIENLLQSEMAVFIEAAFLPVGSAIGNGRGLAATPTAPSDRCVGREPTPPVDIEGLLEAPLRFLARKFGSLQKCIDGRRQMLQR